MSSSDIRVRLRALLARKRVEEDLNAELAFHLEMQAKKCRGRHVFFTFAIFLLLAIIIDNILSVCILRYDKT